MKAFKFPLEKVLGWRHLQMRAEEEKLTVLQQHLALLNRRAHSLATAELNTKLRILKMDSVQGSELNALASFQERLKKERALVAGEKAQCEKRLAAQRVRLLKARKDYRILEKLRDRRLEEWTYSFNRELENDAADAYLAKLARGEQ